MNNIKQYLCDTLGVDDQEQADLYQEVYGYAKQECEDLLESDASDEVKDKVDVELKDSDVKMETARSGGAGGRACVAAGLRA